MILDSAQNILHHVRNNFGFCSKYSAVMSGIILDSTQNILQSKIISDMTKVEIFFSASKGFCLVLRKFWANFEPKTCLAALLSAKQGTA